MNHSYSPEQLEPQVLDFWLKGDYYIPTPKEDHLETYSILMPPPNVTNVLHLGHALNNTVQDVMTRYYRMLGKASMWKPGVDHAGIATENMVEKYLREQGIEKSSLTQEEFLKYVWEWKAQYGSKIVDQLKRIGSSCDWDHLRFTMDEVSQKAVQEIFIKLYKDNLIYRAEYIVNWCSKCLTALSDEEVESEETQGFMYHIYYGIKDSDEKVVVATTRPETIFGDVAIAVNPNDSRYQHLIGKKAISPIAGQEVVIIADESVEMDFGTGVLKITPSHDVTDFEIGQRHHLPFKEVISKDGKMNEKALDYQGLDRFEARKRFIKELEEKELLVEAKAHTHHRGVCYRCSTVIEPRISTQWFVKMEPLAKPALQALKDGKLEFTPKKWEKVYEQWLSNIKDWCISRQITWGHRIPAYHCASCGEFTVSSEAPSSCSSCGASNLTQDPDVLDTWFSSWIWPMTVFDWPNEINQLKRYYPTQFLATAPEIIFFWVARMVMAGIYVMGEVPFSKVFFNSTICDIKGRKMSKSLGNGIDPLDIVKDYGADAMRFTMLYIAPKGERIRIETKSFELGYRLVNKLWNSAKFIFNYKNCQVISIDEVKKDSWDKMILTQLSQTIEKTKQCYEKLDYFELSHILYQFFWNQFCDWYLESSKVKLNDKDPLIQSQKYSVVIYVFESLLKLFHPIIPFVTEYLFGKIYNEPTPLIKAPYPQPFSTKDLELGYLANLKIQQFISSVRNLRADFNFGAFDKLEMILEIKDSELLKEFKESQKEIMLIARLSRLEFDHLKTNNKQKLLFIEDFGTFTLLLDEQFDKAKEQERLKEKLKMIASEIHRAQEKLSNKKFVEFAQAELIHTEKEKLVSYQEQENRIKKALHQIES